MNRNLPRRLPFCVSLLLLLPKIGPVLGHKWCPPSAEIVPTAWDETKNMAWKVDLPGTGSSSPIIVGGKLIVTCYVSGNDAAKRQVLCCRQE